MNTHIFKSKKEEDTTDKPICFNGIEYMGGHKLYPKKVDCNVYLYIDNMDIEFDSRKNKNHIIIPYSKISDFQNEDDEKIRKRRIVALGLIFLPLAILGAVWKKKVRYTVIEYTDKLGMQETVIVDFGKHVERAQQSIYDKITNARAT